MSNRTMHFLAFASCVGLLLISTRAVACPFCSATAQTMTQELQAANVSVLATLSELPPKTDLDSPVGSFTAGAKFKVQEVVRGAEHIEPGTEIEVIYFGDDPLGKTFLVNGVVGDELDWLTPLPLTEDGVAYVKQLDSLPPSGVDRIRHFLGFLEHSDPLLAQDAYEEFARTPYEDVIAIKPDMDREQLVEWIQDPQIGPTRRRLYLTLLGVCGTHEDVDMLESLLLYDYEEMRPGIELLVSLADLSGSSLGMHIMDDLARADVRSKQQCLDALIAAYLKLKGPEGLPLVEERFLTNPRSEYTHLYSAIMALRFHGEESHEIPQQRLIQSMRLLLDNHEIADQVIPDLARWEDWDSLEPLMEMFRDSEKDSWIRQPVISFVLTAEDQPGEVGTRATKAVAELEKLDPTAVKRARSYLSFGLMARAGTGAERPKDDSTTEPSIDPFEADDAESTESLADSTESPDSAESLADSAATEEETTPEQDLVVAETEASPSEEEISTAAVPSRTMIIGLPLVAGALMMALFALLMRGADVRSPDSRPSKPDNP